jgi:hypothetical protein
MGSRNLYAYSHNDGVNFFDPDGEQELPSSPLGYGQPGYPKMQPSSAPMEGDYQSFYDLAARVGFGSLHYGDPAPPSGPSMSSPGYVPPGQSRTVFNLKEPVLTKAVDSVFIVGLPADMGPNTSRPPDYVKRNSGAGVYTPIVNTGKNLQRAENLANNLGSAVESGANAVHDVIARFSENNLIRIVYVEGKDSCSSYWKAMRIQNNNFTQFDSAAFAMARIHGYYSDAFYPIPNGF